MYQAIVFLPLLGFLIVGLFGTSLGAKASEYITSGFLVIAAVLSWVAFFTVGFGHGEVFTVPVMRWIQSGGLEAAWALRIDTLTVVMLVVVNTVSALVHIYSIGYMHHDPNRPRFFAYLSLFTFAMLMLVTSDNLVQMFFGWEGVGLASYLLIGFWYKKPSANAAAIKAFVVNRVGDFGFALGIFGLFVLFGSVNLGTIFANAATFIPAEGAPHGAAVLTFLGYALDKQAAMTIVCLLLFMGAMGKSAQVPLHTWLPDAMEGPTPVSALIHAATMVTAGVFMLARLSPLFELSHSALTVVTFIGAFTAFFAATVGLVQNDIKRVIAYSTCSQLGYMFVALGVGAYGAAIFHLFTHAFFKALLFLGSGSVIHAVSDEQDMRKMGGLRKLIPTTYWMMVIGTLALTGVGIPVTVIGTAGFFSKDAIIESAFAGHNSVAGMAFVLLVIAACFTSFYSWRLIFMTFHGKPRASHEVMHHVHESPPVMLVPLFILAAGALFAGVIFHGAFIGEGYAEFWKASLFTLPDNHILHDIHELPLWVELSPFIAMLIGFALAWKFYIRSPEMPVNLAAQHRGLYAFLLNKWYFDELYDFLFVRPAKRLGHFLWKTGDGTIIDGLGPDGISARVVDVTDRVVKLQTGYLYHYAFAMLIGVAALVTWMML
ncbi:MULTISPECIES: NADH-quinone oxidoreductase subunit L [unclassified Mesorhizobium]|uniref:NADH-quinone oxidoreductase subunit L n=1 Tax=unclassified Mesorhizobium TaxID=325217 RepID=UPI000FCCBF06|nr:MULTISPECIES: NADH-quinone oxidoreductase subunit L [unclassified Mesorhizobium]RUT85832.1 NADH-quinone oxidoreductase subunit L [Mesorhizobium sp. M7A.T.Ca.US.000.02.2.1]RUT86049.1 NADH-quinone oxidoreductase subunit L [Mesorhizobium sp. M7A.T.Ca.US.000.02.1.1]RUU02855.1 NADH-quinone oxidoreductase subunit L [Mesorhizobium sp. M7A.T.Ca.TU.009.02.1.1]RWN33863.1 MAG: NADH-quinone oxidoreductase subunit L [Mesorhizobium sp.]TJV25497.1 MAG: NADH-quinone oxidoreductase subunit L [Mesorhizobium 